MSGILTMNLIEVACYDSIKDASLETKIVANCISRAANKKRKSASGFVWEFVV